MSRKTKTRLELQCPSCKQTFFHLQLDARDRVPMYCSPACLLAAQREQARAASKNAPRPTSSPKMPNTYEVHVKDSARRYPAKVTRVCWVWWDRAAKRYRGTVRDVPVQEQWDCYRIWQDAHVVSEVEAETIPELVELLRRYAAINADIQQKLLRDTPPSLRRSSDVAGAAATTEVS